MAIAGGNITLDSTEGMDKITQTDKVTSPYFSNGDTNLAGASIVSSSLTDTNETYFFGISNSSTPTVEEFNVAFGSTNGFGSNDDADAIKAPTDAIYKQYSSLLLAPTEVTGGFKISQEGSAGQLDTADTEIYVMTARRSNMKDRLNKGTWQINLSGSNTAGDFGTKVGANGNTLFLKDDSSTTSPTATPAGDRYNIVSCSSAGVIAGAATVQNFGYFYPDMGIMVFSAAELSSSIPGAGANEDDVVKFNEATHKGFGHTKSVVNANSKTALRFINCLTSGTSTTGANLKFRDEEDQVSAQYFCRVRSAHMNFSNNPTFVSGSLNELRATKMKGSPQTFITSVQLYNDGGEMVAVGNLSTPLKKNFSSEATIKVKLTY
tara:strand:+ start:719 stop:1852 length:1134 start_codon:yes stop_codon:yes gene_type:complete